MDFFHRSIISTLIIALSFAVIVCAVTPMVGMVMDHMHDVGMVKDHVAHAQSLLIFVLSEVLLLLLLVCTVCVKSDDIVILRNNFSFIVFESPPDYNFLKWASFNLRSPPKY